MTSLILSTPRFPLIGVKHILQLRAARNMHLGGIQFWAIWSALRNTDQLLILCFWSKVPQLLCKSNSFWPSLASWTWYITSFCISFGLSVASLLVFYTRCKVCAVWHFSFTYQNACAHIQLCMQYVFTIKYFPQKKKKEKSSPHGNLKHVQYNAVQNWHIIQLV